MIPLLSTFQNFAIRLMSGVASGGCKLRICDLAKVMVTTPHGRMVLVLHGRSTYDEYFNTVSLSTY